MTNSPGCLQQRHGPDCTPAPSDACLYPAWHVLPIIAFLHEKIALHTEPRPECHSKVT